MKRWWSGTIRRLSRKPRVVYVVCPSCQEHEMRAAAMEAITRVDAYRRQRSTNDPVLNRVLGQAEINLAHTVADAAGRRRRLR